MRTRSLRSLLAVLREHGVTYYKGPDFELSFAPVPRTTEARAREKVKPAAMSPEQEDARRMMAAAGLNPETAADLAASMSIGA